MSKKRWKKLYRAKMVENDELARLLSDLARSVDDMREQSLFHITPTYDKVRREIDALGIYVL